MTRPASAVPARAVQSWLDRDPSFRELARRVDDLVALQRALIRACPQAPISVAGLDAAGTLTVVVPGAAWASRLRQIEPTLLAALSREDLRVQRLKIRPRREAMPLPRRSAPKPPLPEAALAALDRLRGELDPSPLQQALAGLIARQRQRR